MERIYCVFTCLEQDRVIRHENIKKKKKNKNYINNNNNNGDEDEKKLRIFVFQGTYIFFIVVNTKIDSIWYNTRWEKGRRRKIKVFGAGFKDKGEFHHKEKEDNFFKL
ncbi:GSCOCG00001019001-RA-CDS [Cotesia congregata]|nr:GSCOCG00001019001-RA-CDS [Cotesia congregata]